VYIEAVINHMRDSQLSTVDCLISPLPTEPYILTGDAGARIEVVVVQPSQRALLDAGSALGDHPDAPAEPLDEPGEHVERTVSRGRADRLLKAAAEKDGILMSSWKSRALDDPTKVNAQSWLNDRIHAPSMPPHSYIHR
jgi:hypothetical protein